MNHGKGLARYGVAKTIDLILRGISSRVLTRIISAGEPDLKMGSTGGLYAALLMHDSISSHLGADC